MIICKICNPQIKGNGYCGKHSIGESEYKEKYNKKVKNLGDLIKQEYVECQHDFVWYSDETSTWKWAGYWRCKNCGLSKF